MDFATPLSGLKSLTYRQPALPAAHLDLVNLLLPLYNNTTAAPDPTVILDHALPLFTLGQTDARWESSCVAMTVISSLVSATSLYHEGPRAPSADGLHPIPSPAPLPPNLPPTLVEFFLPQIPTLLSHAEPRVRTLTSTLISALTSLHPTMYSLLYPGIISQITDTYKNRIVDGAVDDTTGWRNLETSLHCLASLILTISDYTTETYDDAAKPYLVESDIEILEHCAVDHVNRHVRAASLLTYDTILKTISSPTDPTLLPTHFLHKSILRVLSSRLSDNWSQVRMSASVLTRTLLLTLPPATHPAVWSAILPSMCLNRHYLADGVKQFSIATWQQIISKDVGLGLVATHIGGVVVHYLRTLDVDNHVIRESACDAVLELSSSLSSSEQHKGALLPHIPLLLNGLTVCFFDESWPVRDRAGVAVGRFITAYPGECRAFVDSVMYERFVEQIKDPIWSVRSNGAVGLANIARCYEDYRERVKGLFGEMLPLAASEAVRTAKDKKDEANNKELHTDNQLFSCGSLAPKLKKGAGVQKGHVSAKRVAGCSDCTVNRDVRPWEVTDGAVYLLAATCDVYPIEEVVLLANQTVEACRPEHFVEGDDLRRTLFKTFVAMLDKLGVKVFKRHFLSMIVPQLVRTLKRERDMEGSVSQLCVFDAKQAVEDMAKIIGAGIFRGRLEEYEGLDGVDVLFGRGGGGMMGGGPGGEAMTAFGGLNMKEAF